MMLHLPPIKWKQLWQGFFLFTPFVARTSVFGGSGSGLLLLNFESKLNY